MMNSVSFLEVISVVKASVCLRTQISLIARRFIVKANSRISNSLANTIREPFYPFGVIGRFDMRPVGETV